jgi:glycosyltransferase involved in cell wall biosynthesis
MITVGYSTRSTKPEFVEYLKKTSGFKKIEVIEKINNGEKSLSQVYNEIISESENDIIVLCHDDILFETNGWYSKLLKHFEKTEYGIIGVAGTTYMPSSGMWWEQKGRMVGIVNHEHEGKKWVSKYSDSFGNGIRDTVIVDGLFIVIDRRRIKHTFDESVPGFHMYDVNFCFKNFLENVKVGVITNIRITHKSIGMVNQQWDDNRKMFAEKYKDNLPAKIKYKFEDRIKVLLSCLFFKTFTGSELYVYELAKNLQKLNCDVTVMSEIDGPLTKLAKERGIKSISHMEPPGYKLGDGAWGFNGPNGVEPSKEGMFYKISDVTYDIIHTQHKPITERICQLYPDIPKITTIHSEVISLEDPHIDPSIKSYIAIRPEIKEYLNEKFEIENVDVIYNPIDNEKFRPKNIKEENAILFVGTIDYLRENTIRDLIEKSKEDGMELWLVGEDKSNYLNEILENKHVKHFKATWTVEPFIQKAKVTAGIQLGRTTIEGWLCGKPGWIYKVDSSGGILSKEYYEPPTDLEKYYAENVAKQIKEKYIQILNS